jgi:diacylglycerol kinase family enzyme
LPAMRALLVVNPKATTTSERSRDILLRAMRSQVQLDVAYTRQRGHATNLARNARRDGVDVVITLGGDGTVNEVVNGLMAVNSPYSAESATATARPALAVVPGGSANVFARALGMPRDWAEGAYIILEALRAGRFRTVSLGRADERYFTFCAGLGLDAEVVQRVEQARLRGRVATPWLYVRSTIAQYLFDTERRAPLITLERSDHPDELGLACAVVQNTAPWTFLGERAVDACPGASFDTGLDVFGMRVLRLPSTVRMFTHLLATDHEPRGKQVCLLHDVSTFTLRAARPMAFQVDGDYVGERSKVEFVAVPEALRVVC